MRIPFFLMVAWWRQLKRNNIISRTSPTHLYKHLDIRLVQKVCQTGVPSWAQLRHVSKFLSPAEKRTARVCIFAAVLSLLIVFGNFIWSHRILKPARGGEYTEGIIGTPSLINPLFSPLNQADADLAKLIYTGLLRLDEQLTLSNSLAERYEISADGKTYRIVLKDNVKWSDGEPITADDVSFTLERIQDPDTHSPLILLFQNVLFEKINDREFTLVLKEPYAPFINFLTVGILPAHIWQEITPSNMRLSTANLKPVGSGPYALNTITKDETGIIRAYNLKPNEFAGNFAPYIKKLTLKFFPDFNSAFEALKTRQIDGLGHIPFSSLEKVNTKTNTLMSLETSQYTAVFFNPVEQPLLKDKRVRSALALAVNRADLVANIFGTHASTTNGPLVRELFGIRKNEETPAFYDMQSSQLLLESAGWKKISPDERMQNNQTAQLNDWEKKNPAPALPRRASSKQKRVFEEQFSAWQKQKEETLARIVDNARKTAAGQQIYLQKDKTILSLALTVPRQDEFQKAAEYIADSWRALGVEVRIETVELNRVRTNVLKNKQYDALLYSVILTNDGDPYSVWHSSQTNSGGLNLALFANKQADTLLVKARAGASFDARRTYYEQFQTLLDEETPALFLYSPHYLYAMQSNVQGAPQARIFTPDDRFNTVHEWFIKTRWGWKK